MRRYKLAILICTIPKRVDFLLRLMSVLLKQQTGDVVIYTDDREGISKGAKRNELLGRGVEIADYVAFIDDDDLVTDEYVREIMKGIDRGVDCCSLRGVITEDGHNPNMFEHSIRHNAYGAVSDPGGYGRVKYLRFPNHLNAIKSVIAGQFEFPETKHRYGDENHGEDTHWATQLHDAKVLRTEHWIEDIIYYYEYRSKK